MNKSERARRAWLKGMLLAAGGLGLQGVIRQVLAAGGLPHKEGVVRLQGSLRVNGKVLRQGDSVTLPARLETGKGSQAVIVIGRDAFLVHENTRVEMGQDAAGLRFLRMLAGRMLSVFAAGEKRVSTPTAVIGIRGTGMYLDVMPEQTYFCLCYGEADLQSVMDSRQSEYIRTTHHDSPRMIFSTGTEMIATERVKDHSDDELIMLEALVGRIPPFVSAWGAEAGGRNSY